MKQTRFVLILLAIFALWWWFNHPQYGATPDPPVVATRGDPPTPLALPPLPESNAAPQADEAAPALPDFLPREAHHPLALIASDGPFPHRQDGSVFQNRERRLPQQPRGYYREYTVRSPRETDRGARRIVTGGDPPREYWYTDNHYLSFRRFEVPR